MEVTTRHREGVTILEPKGRITIGKGDVALRNAIHETLAAGSAKILIDLRSTSRIDSSGIAEIVAARKAVEQREGKLALMNLPPKIENILGVTQIITVLDVYKDEEEALASFR